MVVLRVYKPTYLEKLEERQTVTRQSSNRSGDIAPFERKASFKLDVRSTRPQGNSESYDKHMSQINLFASVVFNDVMC